MNSPAQAQPEVNRLFGVLAIQNGFATPTDVAAALSRVSAAQDLGEVLQAQKLISSEQRTLLGDLVKQSIDREGDPRRAYESLGGDAVLRPEPPAPTPSAFESFGGDQPVSPPPPPASSAFESFGGDQPLAPSLTATASGSLERRNTFSRTATSQVPSLSSASSLGGTGPLDPAAPLVSLETQGRYQYRREQGKGGQSRVHVAFDRDIAREIAIKELLPERQVNPNAVARFIREARITGQLEHPNIVPIYELGRHEDGSYYCAQKLVRGRTYTDALRACQTFQERLGLLPHFEGLCQAIAYAHSRGVVHRDIKPDNVMVGEFGETVVLDWGLAKSRQQPEPPPEAETDPNAPPPLTTGASAAGETMVGSVIGTPAYMSPEQAMGDPSQIDERSDVWALGVVLFQTLTGRTPFEGDSPFEMIGNVIRAPVPAVRTLAPEAPRDLAAIADKALQRDRALRYENAAQMEAELQAFRLGRRVTAYDYSSLELLKRFVAKNRVLSATVLASVLLIGLAAAVAFSRDRESRRNLASAFVEKAREAERALSWGEAAVFRAAARTYDPAAALRYGVAYDGAFEARPIARLEGHEAPIDFMAVSPDAPLLMTGSRDGTVGFWDIRETATHASPLPGAGGGTDNSAGGGTDNSAGAGTDTSAGAGVGTETGAGAGTGTETGAAAGTGTGSRAGANGTAGGTGPGLIARVPAHPGSSDIVVAISPTGHTAASLGNGDQGTLTFWDPATHHALWTVKAPGRQMALAVSPDDDTLATATGDHLELWSARTRAPLRTWPVTDPPTALGFFDGGRALLSGHASGALRIWDTASGKLVRTLPGGHQGWVSYLRLSRDGKRATSTSYDHHVALWDLAKGTALATFPGHEGPALESAFSPDGNLIASVGFDGWMRVWDVPTRSRVARIKVPGVSLITVSFSPDARALIAAGSDHVLRMWSVPASFKTDPLDPDAHGLTQSEDGRLVAFIAPDKSIGLWSVPTRSLARRLVREKPSDVDTLSFSADGERLAVRSAPDLTVWDTARGAAITSFTEHPSQMLASALSYDGRTLALGLASGKVELWDVDAHRLLATLDPASGTPSTLSFSHDGKTLVAITSDGAVQQWDLETQARATALALPDRGVEFFAFLRDGRPLWQTRDHTLHLGGERPSEPGPSLTGHRGPLVAAALSPDGRTLITASQDATVRVWDLAEGTLIARRDHHWAQPTSIAYGPEPGAFTTGAADGHLRRFHLVSLPSPKEQLSRSEQQFGLRLVGIELEEATR